MWTKKTMFKVVLGILGFVGGLAAVICVILLCNIALNGDEKYPKYTAISLMAVTVLTGGVAKISFDELKKV